MWAKVLAVLWLLEVFCIVHSQTKTQDDTVDINVPIQAATDNINGTDPSDPNSFLSDFYTEWSQWSNCSKRCDQNRKRKCLDKKYCGKTWLTEKRLCKSRRTCAGRSYKVLGFRRKDRLIEEILYKLLYGPWSSWGPCTRSCKRKRVRKCGLPSFCGISYIQEERICKGPGTYCRKHYKLSTLASLEDVQEIKNITSSKKGNKTRINPIPVKLAKDIDGTGVPVKSKVLQSLSPVCGIRPTDATLRIVDGHEARKHSWPWTVAILKGKEQFCGGTLIAPQWVLTAAHCVRKKRKRKKIFVRVAEHDTQNYDVGEKTVKLVADFPNPDYDFDTITNDIALLKLDTPITKIPHTGFACLPDVNDEILPRTLCRTVGWGKEKNTHIFGSTVLQEAEIPIVSRNRCQKVFDYDIHETQICAGFKKGGADSCAGDSGGPLMCPRTVNGTTRWYVYGVTSYGEGCGQKGKFGIYTKVQSYRKWIENTIEVNK